MKTGCLSYRCLHVCLYVFMKVCLHQRADIRYQSSRRNIANYIIIICLDYSNLEILSGYTKHLAGYFFLLAIFKRKMMEFMDCFLFP